MDFGNNIKELRIKKGMTQKDLANVLNVTAQAVSRWENNEVEPSISTINQMAELFDCSIDELFGKTKKEETKSNENIIINVQEEKTREDIKSEPIQVKTNIAICNRCNKPLYEPSEIKRIGHSSHTVSGHTTTTKSYDEIVCEDCYNKEQEKKRELEIIRKEDLKRQMKKRRVISIVIMSLVFILFLIIGIIAIASSNGNKDTVIGGVFFIVTGILGSLFAGSLILGNNFIGDLWLTVSSWGFVKFPGIIFTLDLGGLKFLIFCKVLFWILGIIIALIAEIFATTLCLALSVISYPIALYRNLKGIEIDD